MNVVTTKDKQTQLHYNLGIEKITFLEYVFPNGFNQADMDFMINRILKKHNQIYFIFKEHELVMPYIRQLGAKYYTNGIRNAGKFYEIDRPQLAIGILKRKGHLI